MCEMNINRTLFRKYIPFFIVILGLCILSLTARGQAQKSPNVVFFLADDLTRWDIETYGSRDAVTPTLDKLASEGMKFTNVYQASPMCSPTRHNLLTGRYPTQTGAYPNHTHVKDNIKSVVDYLRPLGYRIALAGKKHIGPERVFDFEYLDKKRNPQFDKVDAFIGDAVSKNQSFSLFLNSNEPHSPWNKGDRSLFKKEELKLRPYFVDTDETREAYRNYLAEINYLDGQVKKALELLEKHGVTDNTVFMFASEQGAAFPFAKWTLYNAGLGSALIVRWPGKVKPGSKSDALVEYSDILPTIVDIAGGEVVDNFDGSSLVPILKGNKTEHKDYSYGIMTTRGIHNNSDYFPIRSVTDGTYRYILNLAPEVQFSNIFMKGHIWDSWEEKAKKSHKAAYLVNRYRHRPAEELYNDEKDPYNMNNLVGKEGYKEIKQRLRDKLFDWMKRNGDQGLFTELRAYERQGRNNANGDSVIIHKKLHSSRGLSDSSNNFEFDYKLFTGSWSEFPDLSSLNQPDQQGTVSSISTGIMEVSSQQYGIFYNGTVQVPQRGYYSFYIKTGQVGKVYVDGKLVVSVTNDKRNFGRYGIIGLMPGKHQVQVQYINKDGKDDNFKVQWSGPNMKRQEL